MRWSRAGQMSGIKGPADGVAFRRSKIRSVSPDPVGVAETCVSCCLTSYAVLPGSLMHTAFCERGNALHILTSGREIQVFQKEVLVYGGCTQRYRSVHHRLAWYSVRQGKASNPSLAALRDIQGEHHVHVGFATCANKKLVKPSNHVVNEK